MHKIEIIQTGGKKIGTFYCAGQGLNLHCKNRRVKAAHLMCQSNTKYVLKACPLF